MLYVGLERILQRMGFSTVLQILIISHMLGDCFFRMRFCLSGTYLVIFPKKKAMYSLCRISKLTVNLYSIWIFQKSISYFRAVFNNPCRNCALTPPPNTFNLQKLTCFFLFAVQFSKNFPGLRPGPQIYSEENGTSTP